MLFRGPCRSPRQITQRTPSARGQAIERKNGEGDGDPGRCKYVINIEPPGGEDDERACVRKTCPMPAVIAVRDGMHAGIHRCVSVQGNRSVQGSDRRKGQGRRFWRQGRRRQRKSKMRNPKCRRDKEGITKCDAAEKDFPQYQKYLAPAHGVRRRHDRRGACSKSPLPSCARSLSARGGKGKAKAAVYLWHGPVQRRYCTQGFSVSA